MKMQLSCGCCDKTCQNKWMPSDYPDEANYSIQVQGDLEWNTETEVLDFEIEPVPTTAKAFADHYTIYQDGLRGSFDVEPSTPVTVEFAGYAAPYRFKDDYIANRSPPLAGRSNFQTEPGKFDYEEPSVYFAGRTTPPCFNEFAGKIQEQKPPRVHNLRPNEPTRISIEYDLVPVGFNVYYDQSEIVTLDLGAIPELGYPAKTVQIRVYYPSTCGPGPHDLTAADESWQNDPSGLIGLGAHPIWGAGHPYGNVFRNLHKFYLSSPPGLGPRWSDIPHTWRNTEQVSISSSQEFNFDYRWEEGKASISVDSLQDNVSAIAGNLLWRFNSYDSVILSAYQGTVSGADTTATLDLTNVAEATLLPEQTIVEVWHMKTPMQGTQRPISFQMLCDAMGVNCDSTKAYFIRTQPNAYGTDGPPTETFDNTFKNVRVIGTVQVVFDAFWPPWLDSGWSASNHTAWIDSEAPEEQQEKPPTWSGSEEPETYQDPDDFSMPLMEESGSPFSSGVTGNFSVERQREPV